MTIIGISGGMSAYGITTSKPGKAEAPDFAALFKALKEEAAKTPEQRAREKVLEKHDLTEESYQALSKDQRTAIDAEIKDAVKRVAEQRRGAARTERMA